MSHNVDLTVKDQIATITLQRPYKRNALNIQLVSELKAIFEKLRVDKGIKASVLRADGSVFCAGADLHELKLKGAAPWHENLEHAKQLVEML